MGSLWRPEGFLFRRTCEPEVDAARRTAIGERKTLPHFTSRLIHVRLPGQARPGWTLLSRLAGARQGYRDSDPGPVLQLRARYPPSRAFTWSTRGTAAATAAVRGGGEGGEGRGGGGEGREGGPRNHEELLHTRRWTPPHWRPRRVSRWAARRLTCAHTHARIIFFPPVRVHVYVLVPCSFPCRRTSEPVPSDTRVSRVCINWCGVFYLLVRDCMRARVCVRALRQALFASVYLRNARVRIFGVHVCTRACVRTYVCIIHNWSGMFFDISLCVCACMCACVHLYVYTKPRLLLAHVYIRWFSIRNVCVLSCHDFRLCAFVCNDAPRSLPSAYTYAEFLVSSTWCRLPDSAGMRCLGRGRAYTCVHERLSVCEISDVRRNLISQEIQKIQMK